MSHTSCPLSLSESDLPFVISLPQRHELPLNVQAHTLIMHTVWACTSISHVPAMMLFPLNACISNFNEHKNPQGRRRGTYVPVKNANSTPAPLPVPRDSICARDPIFAQESAFLTNHSRKSPVKKHCLNPQYLITG